MLVDFHSVDSGLGYDETPHYAFREERDTTMSRHPLLIEILFSDTLTDSIQLAGLLKMN